MRKSTSRFQKINEELVKDTMRNSYYSFSDLYESIFPKHFWQKKFTSWQKEHDDFFASFKEKREFFRNNYKSILSNAINCQISKKQLGKKCLNDDLIFEKKVFIKDETIMTVYFAAQKNRTIGIFQRINFHAPMNLDWNKSGLLDPSSFIGCFCIKDSKFKNF